MRYPIVGDPPAGLNSQKRSQKWKIRKERKIKHPGKTNHNKNWGKLLTKDSNFTWTTKNIRFYLTKDSIAQIACILHDYAMKPPAVPRYPLDKATESVLCETKALFKNAGLFKLFLVFRYYLGMCFFGLLSFVRWRQNNNRLDFKTFEYNTLYG